MISDEYKIIFVHIPRTAGHTISWCFDYNRNSKNKAKRHGTWDIYKHLHPKEFYEYFKFTFVRNPWARILSAWYLAEYRHQDQNKIKTMFNEFVINDLQYILQTRPHHYRSQLFWLLDDKGNMYPYDYVGRSEPNVLLFHINTIRKKLGLSIFEELPIMGASGYPQDWTYRNFYNGRAEKIIMELYKPEIEMMEYSF